MAVIDYAAVVAIVIGSALMLRCGWIAVRRRDEFATRWITGLRRFVVALAVGGIGLGVLVDQPVIIAICAVIGFEETLETSFALDAMRNGEHIRR